MRTLASHCPSLRHFEQTGFPSGKSKWGAFSSVFLRFALGLSFLSAVVRFWFCSNYESGAHLKAHLSRRGLHRDLAAMLAHNTAWRGHNSSM